MKNYSIVILLASTIIMSSAIAGEDCRNGSCTNDWAHEFTVELKAPTQSASDNSTKAATTAFVQSQFGQPHTWSAAQTFSAGVKTTQMDFTNAGASILDNLYYDGNFRYYGDGFGTQLAFDNSTGGVAIYAAPSNSGGAGALATPALIFHLHQTGALQLPAYYTTAGVLTNDASGNVSSVAGFTGTKTIRDAAGTGTCTMIFTNGVLTTGGTC